MSTFRGIDWMVQARSAGPVRPTSADLLSAMEQTWRAIKAHGGGDPAFIVVPRRRRTVRWRNKRMTVHGLPAWLSAVKRGSRG